MLAIVILFFISFVFCLFLIGISHFFGAKSRPSSVQSSAYECGVPASSNKSTRLPVHFFLTGILFIIFDIEIIFMYPFAIAYRTFLKSEQALGILVGMGIFLLLFLFGLWWEVKTRALDWKS